MSAIPSQQIVYTVDGRARNMQSIQQRICWKDGTREDFGGKSINVDTKRQQWDLTRMSQTFCGKFRAAIIGLVNNILSCHEIITMPMEIPPLSCDLLTQNGVWLCLRILAKKAHDRCLDVDCRHDWLSSPNSELHAPSDIGQEGQKTRAK